VRRFSVVVGRRATPTPLGRFFVAERVRQPRGSALGPWVLATSAYSDVLQEFDGGPGQIGLHGRTGLPDPLGTGASHGCIRFSDRAIAWLAPRARPGTPVTIVR
jgi:lipoprotein-anchoring transpeptidase ErfK/SrfK